MVRFDVADGLRNGAVQGREGSKRLTEPEAAFLRLIDNGGERRSGFLHLYSRPWGGACQMELAMPTTRIKGNNWKKEKKTREEKDDG